MVQQQQQQQLSQGSSEDGREDRTAWEAQAAEVQQMKADLLVANSRLRDAGELLGLFNVVLLHIWCCFTPHPA